jgi:putative SOS response-associated peptidase YedK
LRPCPAEWLEALPVSPRVNSPANDDPEILVPPPAATEQRSLI